MSGTKIVETKDVRVIRVLTETPQDDGSTIVTAEFWGADGTKLWEVSETRPAAPTKTDKKEDAVAAG